MNVNDIKTEAPEIGLLDCRLIKIFERQRSLMRRYEPIERDNGFRTFKLPVDIDDRFVQYRLKDMAWRVTEELAEATEARWNHPTELTHCREELSDAFHFLIELLITVGIEPINIRQQIKDSDIYTEYLGSSNCTLKRVFYRTQKHSPEYLHVSCYKLIETLGKAMNCLKNKPWKNSHLITDKDKFMGYMLETPFRIADCALDSGMDHDFFYKMYFKKSEVNKFRIESNY